MDDREQRAVRCDGDARVCEELREAAKLAPPRFVLLGIAMQVAPKISGGIYLRGMEEPIVNRHAHVPSLFFLLGV